MAETPTQQNYGTIEEVYAYFNLTLFVNQLPPCLITLQRRRGAYGYFSGSRFQKMGGEESVDEIALNPRYFIGRPVRKIYSTLAHEMVHLFQHHYGKPSRSGYHNKEWAKKMESIGLMPSATGQPDGKKTGQRVTHYIIPGGAFDIACTSWLDRNPAELYYDRAYEAVIEVPKPVDQSKAANKIKYSCPICRANAWGKATLKLICGDCRVNMTTSDHERPGVLEGTIFAGLVRDDRLRSPSQA